MRLLLLLALCTSSWAATATLWPTADATTGGWTTSPLWSKVGADDATTINSGNNSTTAVIFNVTCPSDVGTITAMTIHFKATAASTSGKVPGAIASWSAGGNNKDSGAMTTTPTTYTGTQATGLSISKATCNSSTLTVTPRVVSGTGAATSINLDSVGIDIVYTVAANTKVRHNVSSSGDDE